MIPLRLLWKMGGSLINHTRTAQLIFIVDDAGREYRYERHSPYPPCLMDKLLASDSVCTAFNNQFGYYPDADAVRLVEIK
jgi:hypothetical protein